jgi:hypothetical protein
MPASHAMHLALEFVVGLALLLGVAGCAAFIVCVFGAEVRRAVEKLSATSNTDTECRADTPRPGSDIRPA